MVHGSVASSPQPDGDIAKVLQNYLIAKQKEDNNNQNNENKQNKRMKKIISESQLRQIVAESVKRVLMESVSEGKVKNNIPKFKDRYHTIDGRDYWGMSPEERVELGKHNDRTWVRNHHYDPYEIRADLKRQGINTLKDTKDYLSYTVSGVKQLGGIGYLMNPGTYVHTDGPEYDFDEYGNPYWAGGTDYYIPPKLGNNRWDGK